jgi:hypothetical protein
LKSNQQFDLRKLEKIFLFTVLAATLIYFEISMAAILCSEAKPAGDMHS